MLKKKNLHLLILCSTLCQGIITALSEEVTSESSDFLVRKRRVINHLPVGALPTPIENANYMVTIKENNRAICVGVILSHHTVITATYCIRQEVSFYKVLSGGAYDHRSNTHAITSKAVHYGYVPHEEFDGIALVNVNPPFEYGQKTGNIQLYAGFLPPGTRASVFGWGCSYPPRPGPNTRQRRLRHINVPIINHEECRTTYHGYGSIIITAKHVCTYDSEQYCARADIGAPLVVNNRLAGIHVYKGEYHYSSNPDVFIDLQRDDYSAWIRDNIIYM